MEVNKIYLGDAYKLIKELPDNSVDCIYTDVPYLLPNSRGKSGGFMGKRINNLSNNQLNDISYGIDYKIFDDFIRISKNINIYIWCNKYMVRDILNYFIPIVDKYEIMFWAKDNPVPMTNNVWLSDVEYVLWFSDKNTKLNNGYELKSKWYHSPINKADKDLYDHPTIKPLEYVKRHISHTTKVNDVILDPFLGSGTTAIACKELDRKYIGFEKKEEYFKIAVDRLNNITQVERRMKDNGVLDIFDFLGDE